MFVFLGFTGVCWGITPNLLPNPFYKLQTLDLCKVNSWVPYKMVALTSPGKCAGKCVLYILTSKCASRQQRRALFRHHNFQKWSENGVLVDFYLEICFASQRRALFRHHNFQKWSEHGVFCRFCLGNVLRITTACTFSTSQLPKVVRIWCVL